MTVEICLFPGVQVTLQPTHSHQIDLVGPHQTPLLPLSSAEETCCPPKAATQILARPPDARKLGIYGYPRMAYTGGHAPQVVGN